MGAGTPLPYLKAWRAKRAFSVMYLHHRSGIQRETIWALERGKTAHFDTVALLAKALGITPEQLAHVNPGELHLRIRKNPPITPEAIRFALEWYRRVS